MNARTNRSFLTFALFAAIACTAPAVDGATMTILNLDSPMEGFNDPTPVASVGGNTGTALLRPRGRRGPRVLRPEDGAHKLDRGHAAAAAEHVVRGSAGQFAGRRGFGPRHCGHGG